LYLQIHIIDFDDENNIINKNVLLHQVGEIWHISASPADKCVLSTCYNKSKSFPTILKLKCFDIFESTRIKRLALCKTLKIGVISTGIFFQRSAVPLIIPHPSSVLRSS